MGSTEADTYFSKQEDHLRVERDGRVADVELGEARREGEVAGGDVDFEVAWASSTRGTYDSTGRGSF